MILPRTLSNGHAWRSSDAGQESATEGFAFLGQSSALIVVEPDAAFADGFAEDGVLGTQVVDNPLQFAVGVAGDQACITIDSTTTEMTGSSPATAHLFR